MKKIKVSELPPCTVLKGLYTLGTDANNNSVKVSLEFVEDKANAAQAAATAANTAATNATTAKNAATQAAANANTAATAATQATEQLLLKLGTLIPTGLTVKPVPRLTKGNTQPVYICAQLQPAQAAKNLIFISDNRSVAVTQDGRITVIGEGRSTVQIIPTLNTSLAKVIQVEVGQPTLRLVNTRTRLRLTAAGALRLN